MRTVHKVVYDRLIRPQVHSSGGHNGLHAA